MKRNLWLAMVTCLAYFLGKELWKTLEYLKAQAKVLNEQQQKHKHILLPSMPAISTSTEILFSRMKLYLRVELLLKFSSCDISSGRRQDVKTYPYVWDNTIG
jgi:hypothetical protein